MKFTPFSRCLALSCLLGALTTRAEVKLAAIFGDNMVLQQQMAVPIWGWADPQSEVTVQFAGQTRTTKVDAAGKWLVKLGKLQPSATPQNLVVMGKSVLSLTNILVGEVWLASGQSNMEKPIGKQPGQKPTFNAEAELAAANYPLIRLFKVDRTVAAEPQADLTKYNPWQACSSNSLDTISFSAAAYFFGREIHTNLNIPIGLIESSWGGTRIEPWTPPVGFQQIPAQAKLAVPVVSTNKIPNTRPMVIYNSMIAPLAGYALRGVLWYQGESNLMGTNENNDYLDYTDKMQALVGGWREIWGEGSFPFYFVQIAPFKYYSGKTRRVNQLDQLPQFWNLQAQAARRIKHTGMVVTTDLVDNLDDIHPRNKSEVGHRLALLAREHTYGEAVVSSGPVWRGAKFKDGKAILIFDHAEGGLASKDGQPLSGFAVAGPDGRFLDAVAQIHGDTVELSAAGISQPTVARFAWSETAQPNFVNGAGLPAVPFRTDKPIK